MPQHAVNNSFNTLDTDFKAEVIAAELVETGIAPQLIIIAPLGAFKRPFRKDVDSVKEDVLGYDNKEYYLVYTCQEGIYDMLPEGLFHNPISDKSNKSKEEIIEEIRRHRKEEKEARRFFLPFEATINGLRLQVALHENWLDKKEHHNDLIDIFAGHWELFQYLDTRQSNIFLHLLPLIHKIRDDHDAIETCVEMIFQLPVSILSRRQPPLHPCPYIVSRLGENRLGVDFTTGNMVYDEGDNEILIYIGPMQNQQLLSFMPGNKNNTILQLLCDHLLPVHLDVTVVLELDTLQRVARLPDKQVSDNSTIGVDMFL